MAQPPFPSVVVLGRAPLKFAGRHECIEVTSYSIDVILKSDLKIYYLLLYFNFDSVMDLHESHLTSLRIYLLCITFFFVLDELVVKDKICRSLVHKFLKDNLLNPFSIPACESNSLTQPLN